MAVYTYEFDFLFIKRCASKRKKKKTEKKRRNVEKTFLYYKYVKVHTSIAIGLLFSFKIKNVLLKLRKIKSCR